jgi:hypothetical protein
VFQVVFCLSIQFPHKGNFLPEASYGYFARFNLQEVDRLDGDSCIKS